MKKIFVLLLVLMMILSSVALAEESNPFSTIKINEICASCTKRVAVLTNSKSPDWIELYNDSDEEVNLNGLCLSDSKKKLEKFTFGDITIAAHGYVVVYCTGEEGMVKTAICAPFKLSGEGEKVILSYQGEILQKVTFEAQEKDTSMVMNNQGEWIKTYTPTPGVENILTENAK